MSDDALARRQNSRVASIAGILLAAGAGTRMGQPKALVRGFDGVPWVVRGARILLAAGCSPGVVVLGARAAEAEALLDASFSAEDLVIVRAEEWQSGMAASLRAGLAAAATSAI